MKSNKHIHISLTNISTEELDLLSDNLTNKLNVPVTSSHYIQASAARPEDISAVINWAIAGLSWDLLKLFLKTLKDELHKKNRKLKSSVWVKVIFEIDDDTAVINVYVDTSDIDKAIDSISTVVNISLATESAHNKKLISVGWDEEDGLKIQKI